MKIWRRDSTKPIKGGDSKKEKEEELTDISQSSTPKSEPKKDKMEEIYSTKDKQVKYKRQTPLEAEEAARRAKLAKTELLSGKGEISLNAEKDNDEFVELTSDFEEGTVIAEDIIDVEEAPELSAPRAVEIQDIDEIDIDIDPTTTVKKYERQMSDKERQNERYKKIYENEYERIFGKPKYDYGGEKIVSKIPTYQHDSKINLIHLKAGKFTDVVENEYDEYLKSNDPTISKRISDINNKIDQKQSLLYALSQMASHKNGDKHKESERDTNKEQTQKAPKKPQSKFRKFFRILGTLLFPGSKKPKPVTKPDVARSDYQNRQDAKHLAGEMHKNFSKLTTKVCLLSALFFIAFVLTIMEKTMGTDMFNGALYTPIIYCGINLLILILTGIIARPFISSGLKALRSFKGNSDTAVSCAYIACLLQQIFAMFCANSFVGSTLHTYTTIVTLGFVLNTAGRMFMVSRVKENFKFITSKSPAYAAKIFNDDDTARKMLSGTSASHSVIAYQHPTSFLSDFLKISYAPDPSEDISGRFAPITIVSSFFVAVVYGIIFKTFIGAVCALAVMSCISIPLCALLAGNIPMKFLCKDSLKSNAMLSGYPSIKQFCDSDAVMVDAAELYPKGCIKLHTINHFAQLRVDDSLLAAAVILKEANSPLQHVFSDMLEEHSGYLPKVESVLYEDKLGLVGWVGGERVLIGNHKLLDRFHIYVEDAADEAKYKRKGKEVIYIACAGQLVSMLVCTYSPDKHIKEVLSRAQSIGLCLVVRTTDCNITQEKLSEDYALFYRTVKILSTGFASTCNEVVNTKEDTSRAYLATRGKFTSLVHAVTSAVSFKNNLTIALIIQIFGLVLGVLLCATMVLYASVSILGVFEMLLYMLFWSIATIAVQFIRRP